MFYEPKSGIEAQVQYPDPRLSAMWTKHPKQTIPELTYPSFCDKPTKKTSLPLTEPDLYHL